MKLLDKIKMTTFNMNKGIKRFPNTIIFTTILCLFSIYTVKTEFSNKLILKDDDIIKLLVLSVPFSAMLELIREKYFNNKNKILMRIVFFGVVVFDLLLFTRFYSLDEEINYIGLFLLFYTGFILVPLINKKYKEDYVLKVLLNQIITIGFSIILFLGLISLIRLIFGLLIGEDTFLEFNWYTYSFIISSTIFAVTFFLSRIEDLYENNKNNKVNIIKKMYYYMLIPIVTTYTFILYIYTFKIILLRQMPKGTVSHLVLWYTVYSLQLLIKITPLIDESNIAKKFRKLFPYFSIPLLILSLISISIRINQYGVTVNRYLVVILVIWLMFNMILYVLNKNNAQKIIVSFIVVLVIAILSPLNAINISKISQKNRKENPNLVEKEKYYYVIFPKGYKMSEIKEISGYNNFATDLSNQDIVMYSEKYEIKTNKNKLKIKNRKENKELIEIDLDKITTEIYSKLDEKIKDNEIEEYTREVDKNLMEVTFENEKIKYRINYERIIINPSGEIQSYYYEILFSEK